MCDYSLHAQPNRLANEGERLVLYKFTGGSMGFVAQGELETYKSAVARPKFQLNWNSVKEYMRTWTARQGKCPLTAVCIPPGARLHLEDIAPHVQRDFGVSKDEYVTFTQLGCEAYTYRDAVRFNNGKQLLLQRLAENQCATVLSMGGQAEPARGNATPIGATAVYGRAAW
ncbi:MAG: hypothetical protein IT168_21390 [Bryobacterales bacterium]|nr:hypothetical protein [Bryobacterales bacterium]